MARKGVDGGDVLLGAFAGLVLSRMLAPRPAPRPPLGPRVQEALLRACAALGVTVPALFVTNEETLFYAVADGVVYNPVYVDAMLRRLCPSTLAEDTALVGIFGHEMAHRAFGDRGYTVHCDANHIQELRADALAGWVVGALGQPLEYLQVVLREISADGQCRHPGPDPRASAARIGHDMARGMLGWETIARQFRS